MMESLEKSNNVDLIIFDLDGTLVDSRMDIASAVNQGILAVGGQARAYEDIFPLIGRPLVKMFLALLPEKLRPSAERAAEAYRHYYYDHCTDTSVLYPGVIECLEGLSSVPLAIATTKMTFMAVKVAQELKITHYFKLIQGSDGIPFKPDPAILIMVSEQLKKRADKSWMVGDTVYDIQAGKAAGMHTCAVTYGIGSFEDIQVQGPDLILTSLSDFPAKIGIGARGEK